MQNRMERINELLRQQVSQILEEEAEELGLVSVVAVQTSRDLSVCEIFVVPIQGDAERLLRILAERAGAYRKRLAESVELRRLPELRFAVDTNTDSVDRVEELLSEIAQEENK